VLSFLLYRERVLLGPANKKANLAKRALRFHSRSPYSFLSSAPPPLAHSPIRPSPHTISLLLSLSLSLSLSSSLFLSLLSLLSSSLLLFLSILSLALFFSHTPFSHGLCRVCALYVCDAGRVFTFFDSYSYRRIDILPLYSGSKVFGNCQFRVLFVFPLQLTFIQERVSLSLLFYPTTFIKANLVAQSYKLFVLLKNYTINIAYYLMLLTIWIDCII
jgi:hypothetical protein